MVGKRFAVAFVALGLAGWGFSVQPATAGHRHHHNYEHPAYWYYSYSPHHRHDNWRYRRVDERRHGSNCDYAWRDGQLYWCCYPRRR
jgi:hypothetical protein